MPSQVHGREDIGSSEGRRCSTCIVRFVSHVHGIFPFIRRGISFVLFEPGNGCNRLLVVDLMPPYAIGACLYYTKEECYVTH